MKTTELSAWRSQAERDGWLEVGEDGGDARAKCGWFSTCQAEGRPYVKAMRLPRRSSMLVSVLPLYGKPFDYLTQERLRSAMQRHRASTRFLTTAGQWKVTCGGVSRDQMPALLAAVAEALRGDAKCSSP